MVTKTIKIDNNSGSIEFENIKDIKNKPIKTTERKDRRVYINQIFDKGSIFGPNCIFIICEFGNNCDLGAGSKFINRCNFGNKCVFGGACEFDELATFSNNCKFNRVCSFKKFCKFGEFCEFNEGCKFDKHTEFKAHCIFNKLCKFRLSCLFDKTCDRQKPYWLETEWIDKIPKPVWETIIE